MGVEGPDLTWFAHEPIDRAMGLENKSPLPERQPVVRVLMEIGMLVNELPVIMEETCLEQIAPIEADEDG